MASSSSHRLHILLFLATCLLAENSLAWDSVGHRLSAAVALQYLSSSTGSELRDILQQHPRYRQDFQEQMPASISRGSEQEQLRWLLGQAAFWPDVARGFADADRDKYHRGDWHYIDGAWLRGQANVQGNTYLGAAVFADVPGWVAGRGSDEESIDNVMLALDYNTALLADASAPPTQRAVALCWVLHLMGDIHQPLHVGSLYSAKLFAGGDRGGNGVQTDRGNLHARWDRALRDEGISDSLEVLMSSHSTTLDRMSEDEDWSLWMKESRALLLNTVYTNQMKSAILRADRTATALDEFQLDDDYVATMKYHARLRLALAGRRLALWFENNL